MGCLAEGVAELYPERSPEEEGIPPWLLKQSESLTHCEPGFSRFQLPLSVLPSPRSVAQSGHAMVFQREQAYEMPAWCPVGIRSVLQRHRLLERSKVLHTNWEAGIPGRW